MLRNHNHKEKLVTHDLRKSGDAASASGRSSQSDRHRGDPTNVRTVKLTDREILRMNDLYERSSW